MANSTLLKSILILLLFGLPNFMYSQVTATGTVTDSESGEALIGVNILVKGTSTGTTTDFDGNYEIQLPEAGDALVFSYTGYQSRELSIQESGNFNVTLSSGEILEEVVVIGYGTVKKEDLTGSIQSVSSNDFNRGVITGPQELLSGKVAGVSVTTDPSPGGGATIRVRGESSIGASNDPLIVIDGVPLDNGGVSGGRNPLNVINPNDIESMTVLKDASAAAIYGNRAAGGVIMITTKKGALNSGINVGYNGTVSIGNPSNFVDVLTAAEYKQALTDYYGEEHTSLTLIGDADTDWQNEIYRSATSHDHNLNFSGGVANIPYRLSVGYSDVQGILKTDQFDRYTGSININPGFFDNMLQVKLGSKAMLSKNHFADHGAIGNAVYFDPTQAVYDENSPFGGYTTWMNGDIVNTLAPTNPLSLLELKDDNSTVKRYISNASLDYRFHFLPELRANLNLAYDYSFGSGTVTAPKEAAFTTGNGGGIDNWYNSEKKNSLLEYYMNYKNTFGLHAFDLMGGYSWQHVSWFNEYRNSNTDGSETYTSEGSDPWEYYLVSFFGRLNYGFTDKLLLTFTLRNDGTSRFSPDARWGLFPAAAIAYKVLDNDEKYFNSLKLRAGWGKTGQQDIGNYYAYLPSYELSLPNAQYQFGDHYINTFRPNGYDESIKWEETETYNLAADFSLINQRLSGSLEFYQKYTYDLLNWISVPAGTNLTNYIWTNIGDMETQGYELSLQITPVSNEKINWDISTNISYSKSKITKLISGEDNPDYIGELVGGISGGVGSNIQIHSVGYEPYSFYVYEQMYDDDGNILEGQFVDRNEDGQVNDLDKYRYQKRYPDYSFGLTNNFSYGDFYLNFAARAVIGNYVYNNVQTDAGYLKRMYHSTNYLANVHSSAVDLNVENQANLTFSDHFVKPADYLRFDHLTLGYNLDNLIGYGLGIYFTVQNPFVFTKYDGLDPEIFSGIDNNIYPRPRTFVFGLNANFSTKK